MDQITTRLATVEDLADLADLWYENQVLLQQSDTRLTVAPDGKAKWLDEMVHWLANPQCAIWVALLGDRRQGYSIVRLQEMPPGVMPASVGMLLDMAVDLHSPSRGAAQALLDAARIWLAQHEIENLIIVASPRQPVQQAFWQVQGAKAWMDLMWLRL